MQRKKKEKKKEKERKKNNVLGCLPMFGECNNLIAGAGQNVARVPRELGWYAWGKLKEKQVQLS